MTLPIIAVLLILGLAIFLFVTDKLRVDLVAMLVLLALAITGLITPVEALSGFSSPAVVTAGAVFVLSGGLARTGVAEIVGRQVLRLSGKSEFRLTAVIMLTAGVMSAFMNNVGVAALLLPVVLIICRQINMPPSKLLIPLSFGCLLGGLMTLIGTAPNILANEIVQDFGLAGLQFFDFLPVGAVVMLAGVGYMVFLGRHLLPNRSAVMALSEQNEDAIDPTLLFSLEERLALVELPADSLLAGKTLAQSRLGRTLGLTVLGLQRDDQKQMSIQPDTVLQGNDQLLALGRVERLEALGRRPFLLPVADDPTVQQLISTEVGLAEWTIPPNSPLVGQTLAQTGLRREYGLHVISIDRQGAWQRTNLSTISLLAGDRLVMQGRHEVITAVQSQPPFKGSFHIIDQSEAKVGDFGLSESILLVRIPEASPLVGQSLTQSHLSQLFGLEALSLIRNGETNLLPDPDSPLMANDLLLVEGDPAELEIMRGLQGLRIRRQLQMAQVELESEAVGLVEAVLSPHTTLVNKSLRDLHFREKYGVTVLAIWRNGRAYRSSLANMPLQFGDAFLLYGPRAKISLLGSEPDFLLLQDEVPTAPRRHKAGLAAAIMTAVILTALIGWLPIALAALAGAAMMVLTGCLNMEEAYRYIEWRAIFLIACMLTMGIAMETSGAAQLLAEGMLSLVGEFGDIAILAGFFLMTSLAAQVMPSAVVMVLMAPIALNLAAEVNISPYALIMLIAVAASTSFMSPVGHPVNVLMMGPGGYRFTDYTKVGVPLVIVALLITLLVLPLVWPLRP
ncbi:SLC13 family permease [Candidatus Leptofilum sp.]|uniref:SLC13 family permease n=1 Tax=Candidatus Leptofilum sp. TaxID=3241576 RepID=UPI003B59CD79